jgi:hypothetical protein
MMYKHPFSLIFIGVLAKTPAHSIVVNGLHPELQLCDSQSESNTSWDHLWTAELLLQLEGLGRGNEHVKGAGVGGGKAPHELLHAQVRDPRLDGGCLL